MQQYVLTHLSPKKSIKKLSQESCCTKILFTLLKNVTEIHVKVALLDTTRGLILSSVKGERVCSYLRNTVLKVGVVEDEAGCTVPPRVPGVIAAAPLITIQPAGRV